MYVHNIDPVLLNLGPVQIRYYGLVYVIGFLLALFVLIKAAEKKQIKRLNKELAYDYIFWLMISSIVGGRLFFELIYNFMSFMKNPLQFFYIWQGGMSFHGGVIGAIIATYYFTRKYKIRFYDIADTLVLPFSFILIFGRIANFINGELWGTITNVPWCVDFGDKLCRHPSQLYEAAKNVVIFSILSYMKNLKLRKGTLFWSFIGMYGLFRFLVTFTRVAEYYFLGIGIGQWLSLLMVPVAGYMLYRIYRK